MSKYQFDNFYATLREIHADFQRQIRAVMENPDLSEQGKARLIAEKKAARTEKLANLKSTFAGELAKKREVLSRKAEPKPTVRETLRRRAADDAEMFSSLFSDDVRFDVLISAVENLQASLGNFLEMQSLSQRDEAWFRKELQRGLDSKNVARLEQLSKALPLLPNGDISERLQTEYGAAISSLKEEMLTPAERESRDQVAELDKAAELFNYSVANVDTRDEFTDLRMQETEPATILTAVNPKLGVSPTAAKFARYKGGLDPIEN